MKCCQHNRIFMVTMCVLIIFSIGLTGCTDAAGKELLPTFAPIFEGLNAPPVEVTIGQISDNYEIDPIAADDKYRRKRFCFYNVEVEEVDDSNTKRFFMAGNVKFFLRSTSMMQNVEPGFVLNLIGECKGLVGASREIVTVNDCWVESVVGDLGIDEPANIY